MTIHAAILAWWADDETLAALLPATKVYTGRVPTGVTLPYASLSQPSGASGGRSSGSDYTDLAIRVQVWTETFTEGQAIADAVEQALANRSTGLDEDSRIVDTTHDSTFSVQESDPETKVWQFVVQLTVARARSRVH